MFDQQIESASNKLIQFIQDLTLNFQTIISNKNFIEIFHLRSDYAKQLASLFHILIEDFLINQNIQIKINLDPVHMWRIIQNSIEQLNDIQSKDLDIIINHIQIINKFFYNLLVQLKNPEFFNIDQIRRINTNLIEELNHLSQSLIQFTNNTSEPIDTYLFQGVSNPAMNSNCSSFIPPDPKLIHGESNNKPPPFCIPTPVVYTPEMETLFSSGGIIYARKSGNTWVAENLGTLIETLKDIGQTIDMNEHCEILVRKTGELYVRRKRGRRKRFLQKNNEQSDSNESNDND